MTDEQLEAAIHAEPILSDWTKRYWQREERFVPMLQISIEDYRDRLLARIRATSQPNPTEAAS